MTAYHREGASIKEKRRLITENTNIIAWAIVSDKNNPHF